MASLLRQIVVLAALAGGAGWAIQTQFPQEAAGDGEARKRPPVSVAVAEARAGEVERVVSAIARRGVSISRSGDNAGIFILVAAGRSGTGGTARGCGVEVQISITR